MSFDCVGVCAPPSEDALELRVREDVSTDSDVDDDELDVSDVARFLIIVFFFEREPAAANETPAGILAGVSELRD